MNAGPEPGNELAAEDTTEHLDGQKEPLRRADPAIMIGGEPSSGQHTMDMRMKQQSLIPGVQHAEEPDLRSEMARIFEILREPLRDYLPDDHDYDNTFDWLEYLLTLTYCDLQNSEAKLSEERQRDAEFYLWAPVGRFALKAADKSIVAKTAISAAGEMPVEVAIALRNGFFAAKSETDSGKYVQVKGAVDRLTTLVRRQWAIYF